MPALFLTTPLKSGSNMVEVHIARGVHVDGKPPYGSFMDFTTKFPATGGTGFLIDYDKEGVPSLFYVPPN